MSAYDFTALPMAQLAALLRAQFSPAKRQELSSLLLEPEIEDADSVRESLRQAVAEAKQYRRGELQLPTLDEFLHEL